MRMNVKFLNLNRMYNVLAAEIDHEIKQLFESGSFIAGEALERFENDWANYCNANFAVGVGNGLDALVLSLKALNVGSGDEVIVPANTFIATWLAVSHCGAKIVPVDPNPDSFVIEAATVEPKITKKTKVILPVHLYGNPVNMVEINNLAKKYDLFVVEDAAQAQGGRINAKPIGSHGDITAWSFYPGKNLGAFGDAGAITTNSSDIADKIAMLRNYGSKEKYKHDLIGYNSRLDPIQAVILSIKLRYLEQWNSNKTEIAAYYCKKFSGLPIKMPATSFSYGQPVFHQFVIKTDMRQSLQNYLSMQNVETMIHYPVPPFNQKAYTDIGFKNNDFPITTELSEKILSLPIDPLMSANEIAHVANMVSGFFER